MTAMLLNDPCLDWLQNLSDWEVRFPILPPILPWDEEDEDWVMDCQDCHDVLAYLDLTGNLDAPL